MGALAVAIGRTWSGGVMALVTNVAVVGGPLRTGRTSSIERVIRVGMSPHGAITGGALVDGSGGWLGCVTGTEIRGTAVVLPAAIALAAARQIVERGGERQGFLGISTMTVKIPDRPGADASTTHGISSITGVTSGSPADKAGLLVGDVVTAFAGEAARRSRSAPDTAARRSHRQAGYPDNPARRREQGCGGHRGGAFIAT